MAGLETNGNPGEPGEPGEPAHGSRGGRGGRGDSGGQGGSPYGSGGTGGSGGAGGLGVGSWRGFASQAVFVLLVIFVPLLFGLWFLEHQRISGQNRDAKARAALQAEAARNSADDDWQLYDSQIDACGRGNVIRRKQNTIIVELHRLNHSFNVHQTIIPICTDVIGPPSTPRPAEVNPVP